MDTEPQKRKKRQILAKNKPKQATQTTLASSQTQQKDSAKSDPAKSKQPAAPLVRPHQQNVRKRHVFFKHKQNANAVQLVRQTQQTWVAQSDWSENKQGQLYPFRFHQTETRDYKRTPYIENKSSKHNLQATGGKSQKEITEKKRQIKTQTS